MQQPLIPENEAERLQALLGTALLDTAAEPRFDRLTALVQQFFSTDIVLVSLVDSNRQWFKSCQGLSPCATGRDISFCGHAILGADIFEICDAFTDARFADNPLVTGAPYIRFYAGAPLTIAGQRIGTLCLIDPKPRQLDNRERQILRQFADVIEQEIADRLQQQAERELKASRDQFQTLVANIPGITYRCKADSDWTMLYMSGSIDPLSGYPASDFINNSVRSYASVIHPDDRDWLDKDVAISIKTKQSWQLKYRVIHKNGTLRWVEERGRAHYNDCAEVTYLDGFILDITEERKLRQQLLALTSQLPGVVYQYQQWPDGRAAFPYASNAFEKIYGVTVEQVKEDASAAFAKIYPEDIPALVESIAASANNLSLWRHQYRVQRDNNQLSWLSGRATPEAMLDGSTLWHGYIEDITSSKDYYLELERVNKALKLTQQRLDMASENALIGFWQASLKSGELLWSPVIYQIFGFDDSITPSVALFKSTIHPQDRLLVQQSEQRALETGLHDVVHRIIRPDGRIRWVHELARMLPEADNPGQVLFGSVQDVTERMQLAQMKDQFIATVSHELRTPLTSINGALALLNSAALGQIPANMQRLLKVAFGNSERLTQLVNDLLDIEKLSAGKMPFDIQPLQVKAELHKAIENIQLFANQHQVQLHILPPVTTLVVLADSLSLQQVFTNLLSNAIKFSIKDGMVSLSAWQKDKMIRIEVKDTGNGIPLPFQSRIFERFAQADDSNQRQNRGTGLGLAICKELLEQMQGDIGFISEVGRGTTFYFDLPLASVNIKNSKR
jgi:PAS domain S-box-containing protein